MTTKNGFVANPDHYGGNYKLPVISVKLTHTPVSQCLPPTHLPTRGGNYPLLIYGYSSSPPNPEWGFLHVNRRFGGRPSTPNLTYRFLHFYSMKIAMSELLQINEENRLSVGFPHIERLKFKQIWVNASFLRSLVVYPRKYSQKFTKRVYMY